MNLKTRHLFLFFCQYMIVILNVIVRLSFSSAFIDVQWLKVRWNKWTKKKAAKERKALDDVIWSWLNDRQAINWRARWRQRPKFEEAYRNQERWDFFCLESRETKIRTTGTRQYRVGHWRSDKQPNLSEYWLPHWSQYSRFPTSDHWPSPVQLWTD